jgi:hypothetical protein
MTLVGEHGFSWPRNAKNLAQIKKLLHGKKGVYVLSHGAMPMYVGKGKIASRVRGHAKNASTKSKYWDHFSWFVINGGFQDELEVVLLRTLPFYVRSLNRQTGSLGKKNRIAAEDHTPECIPLPKLPHEKKRKKK